MVTAAKRAFGLANAAFIAALWRLLFKALCRTAKSHLTTLPRFSANTAPPVITPAVPDLSACSHIEMYESAPRRSRR